MPINVVENRKMVTTNFWPEVEMLPFLRIRTKKMTQNVANDHQQPNIPLLNEIGVAEFNGCDAISVAHQNVGGPSSDVARKGRGAGNCPPPNCRLSPQTISFEKFFDLICHQCTPRMSQFVTIGGINQNNFCSLRSQHGFMPPFS